jgi:hypothetical protein
LNRSLGVREPHVPLDQPHTINAEFLLEHSQFQDVIRTGSVLLPHQRLGEVCLLWS